MTYIYYNIMSWKFPRVEVKPVVRHLYLISIHDFLLENSVSVSQTVTPSRIVKRSQTIKETSSQSPKTTISESCVMFLINNVLNAEAKVGKTL